MKKCIEIYIEIKKEETHNIEIIFYRNRISGNSKINDF